MFDVSGKGITTSLNVGAFNVMFNEAIDKNQTPYGSIQYLNKKATQYLGENYVAACCFSFDFKNQTAVVVGAGINRFMKIGNRKKLKNI